MIGGNPSVPIESSPLVLRQILIQIYDRTDIIFKIIRNLLLAFLNAEKFVNHRVLLLIKRSRFGIVGDSWSTATSVIQFLSMKRLAIRIRVSDIIIVFIGCSTMIANLPLSSIDSLRFLRCLWDSELVNRWSVGSFHYVLFLIHFLLDEFSLVCHC